MSIPTVYRLADRVFGKFPLQTLLIVLLVLQIVGTVGLDEYGLGWLIVVVAPESDLIAQIHAGTRTTILLCIAALIESISVGIVTTRWITKLILRLNTLAKDIAKGEWDKPVKIERSDIAAFQDITERQQAKELIANYNRALEIQIAKRTAELVGANEQLKYEINERIQAELELRQHKELRETIYNESTDAIFLVDPKTLLIIDCNRRAVELFEITGQEDLIGVEGHTLQRRPFTPEEIDQISTEMHQRGFWCREIEYVTRKGKIFWGNIAAKPVRIAGKAVNLVRITDISDRKRAEDALRDNALRERAIAQVVQRMRQSLDINTIFSATTEELRRVVMCDRVAIYQFNPNGSGKVVAESVASGWRTLLLEQNNIPPLTDDLLDSENCAVRAWGITNEPIQDTYLQATQGGTYSQGDNYLASADIYNSGLSPCHIELLERFQARAYLIVPIFCGKKLWGLLACYHNLSTRPWSASEINTVLQIGIQLGVALQQAQLLEETRQQSAALQKAKDAADAANSSKSAFLANMSHELRTPLNGILGYAQIIQKDKNCTPQQKKGIDIIHQCGEHLLTLINDVLDLSKIEAEKVELYPEAINFPSFLKGVSELFHLKAQQKEINFTFLALNQLPSVVHADEKRLRQVLMNLLSNAVKFTDRGGVTFQVEVVHDKDVHRSDNPNAATASLGFLVDGNEQLTMNKIRFQIGDTGIGIAPEQLEKIFLPFEQVGDSSRRTEGTGLGLAITQKILSMMGSEAFVQSTPEVGSRFWFDLDLPVTSNPMESIPIKSSDNIIGYQGEKRKILIVDDRWDNRAFIINMLEPIGFEVIEASDGQEGLEKAVELKPDLIITDLRMPVMDGFQITAALRQLPEFQDTIVIAISASVLETERLHTQASGCQDFLPKPVQAEELLKKIKNYLGLSWIYDGEHETSTQEIYDASGHDAQVAPEEMVIPQIEELVPLYEAAQIAHVTGVKQIATRLKRLSPEYTAFATRILELAANFDCEEIAKLVDRFISQKRE